MAIVVRGLRVHPQYEDLIGVAQSDGLDKCSIPSQRCDIYA